MDFIVCIKRVPQTAEAEVKVDATGKDIVKDRLSFDMNESDTYALEEAVLLKEQFGGTITVISLGDAEAEETIRIALAKGADTAIRIKAEEFGELDGYATARILQAVIAKRPHDLIFTGCMATDDAYSLVGTTLAELLGVPHATLVVKLTLEGKRTHVHRELEGGLMEHLDLALPAVCTIQTGINEPRYASLISIRKAAKKEITLIGKADIQSDAVVNQSQVQSLFTPPVTKQAEMLSGNTNETAAKVAEIIKSKGLI